MKGRKFIGIALCLLLVGCNAPAADEDAIWKPAKAGQQDIAPATDGSWFHLDAALTADRAAWYRSKLEQLNQTSLYSYAAAEDELVLRFLYLPSDGDAFVIVARIHRNARQGEIVSIREDGGALAQHSKPLDEAQCREILQLLKDQAFWYRDSKDTAMGSDGAEWVVECVEVERYRASARGNPRPNDPMVMIGSHLVGLCEDMDEAFKDIF
ncbi:hypothetical protein LJC55_02185 [Eubacteriales bacterium OttesenSCG-928-N14]|nr:hypothetical protein [Eubacteriales bacterium OttesenSCG-928-N14]